VWVPQLLVFTHAVAHPLQAVVQQDSSEGLAQPTVLQWWHGAVFLGGLSALMLLDQPLRGYAQGHRLNQRMKCLAPYDISGRSKFMAPSPGVCWR
jgi:hypothetical protein